MRIIRLLTGWSVRTVVAPRWLAPHGYTFFPFSFCGEVLFRRRNLALCQADLEVDK